MNDKEYEIYKKILEDSHKKHLEKDGVKFPRGIKLFELCYLYKNFQKSVPISEITNVVQAKYPNKDGKQARHLAGNGWYLKTGTSSATIVQYDKKIPHGHLMLFSITEKNPKYNPKKRDEVINAKEWKEILKIFENRGCAVCGVQGLNYDEGHLDDDQGYRNNVVPMCRSCNNWGMKYKLKFELDKNNTLVARPILKGRDFNKT